MPAAACTCPFPLPAAHQADKSSPGSSRQSWQPHLALGCISGVPLAPVLVAQLHVDAWHGKAVTSALPGAQPSQKAAPQPGENRKHLSCSPQEGLLSAAPGVWWKMFFIPCKNVAGEPAVPSAWGLKHICIPWGNLEPLKIEPEVAAGPSLL